IDQEIMRDPFKGKEYKRDIPMHPTPEQEAVLSVLKRMVDNGGYSEVLLHGVTGSGKTEVYLQLIDYIAAKGKRAIMLVPEISLTPQTVDRFKSRFGDSVAIIHSRLSPGERYDQWRFIKEGKALVTIGARSAVFAPVEAPGLIIIDEEHDDSYKSEITPKYNTVDVARQRCKEGRGRSDIPGSGGAMPVDGGGIPPIGMLLLGSATPSINSYYRASRGLITLLGMESRTNNMPLPEVELVDMRSELAAGNRSVFSRKLENEITKNIIDKKQTMLLLNRRGHSSFVLCRNCGYVVRCRSCNISMTYHSHDNRLICHYCGLTSRVPEKCPSCKSLNIRHFGTGTQKVQEEVVRCFPHGSVIRMDADTTSYKNSHDDILSKFREEKIDIMVGTQMIAKGHDFPEVTLVGVLAADSMLNIDDYRASEKTFQLLTQVAGRAGRDRHAGRVVIQSYNTGDYSILAACNHDYQTFYKQEVMVREKLCYPPFTEIGVAMVAGMDDKKTESAVQQVKERVIKEVSVHHSEASSISVASSVSSPFSAECVTILGPMRAPVSKIKDRYRWRLIIKHPDNDMLIELLTNVSDWYNKQRRFDSPYLSVDINPVSMI
ncbi:MAG: primosomal protein N', partial [Clostridiales bacterium]|nr:primosomal protein N' [Clostridiales bacterium]